MRLERKQLFRDIKAAVLLRRSEAVDLALDGLLVLPGISANDRMGDGLITQTVLPIGEILSALQPSLLRPLLDHPLAAGRAIGAVGLAYRFVLVGDTKPDDLRRPGTDPRADVRLSLGRSLAIAAAVDREKVFRVGEKWLGHPSPRLRHTALIMLPDFANDFSTDIFTHLHVLKGEEYPVVRGALVEALTRLGKEGQPLAVLNLLEDWSTDRSANAWVICRTLAASWAADYPEQVRLILRAIYSEHGRSKMIENALKALKRNGLDVDLDRDLVS